MKRALFLAAVAVIALQPIQVSAQIFNGTPNDVEYLKFLDGSNQGGTFGVQVGPYEGQFLGNKAGTTRIADTGPFALYCVDYLHSAGNSNGLVTATDLTGAPDLTGTNTRLMDYSRYQKGAYLSSLFESWTTIRDAEFNNTYERKHIWGGLHAAIWDITTGPSDLGSGNARTNAVREWALAAATANGGGFSTDGWFVLSEKNDLGESGSGQEFLMRTRVVPEPSSMLLMFSGLLMLVGVARGRRQGFLEA